MLTFKTLQRRFVFLLLVPVTLFLLTLGVFGYRFIKNILFQEWRQVAGLKLERAANHMDMQLDGLKLWMRAFARSGQDPHGKEIQPWILQQMQSQPGVSQVKVTWFEPEALAPSPLRQGLQNCPPSTTVYPPGEQIAGMQGELLDQSGKPWAASKFL